MGAPVARRTVAGSLAHGVRSVVTGRRAAHSCGSASVSHRLPPSAVECDCREMPTSAQTRANAPRPEQNRRVDRGAAVPKPSDDRGAAVPRGHVAGVGAGRHDRGAARVEPGLRRDHHRDRVARRRRLRPRRPVRARVPRPVATRRRVRGPAGRVDGAHDARRPRRPVHHAQLHHARLPRRLHGRRLDRAPDRAAGRQRGARDHRRHRRLRCVQRRGIALRARAGRAARVLRGRPGRRRGARVRPVDDRCAPRRPRGRPRAHRGTRSSGAAGCCASSCPSSSAGWSVR